MEIKIDTKKDSDDDIKKAIRFLQTLIGEAGSSGSSEIETTDEVVKGMAGLFGDEPVLGESDEKEDEEDKDEDMQIMTY